jgi:hypothetical protein
VSVYGGSISDRQLFFTVGILLLCGVFGANAGKGFKRHARDEQKKSAEEHFTLATRYLYFPAFLNSAIRRKLENNSWLAFRIRGKAQIHLADHPAKLWAHDDGEYVFWQIEKHLWKFSTERNEATDLPARLWDVEVGNTLKSWRAEDRPKPNQREEMKCERYILHESLENIASQFKRCTLAQFADVLVQCGMINRRTRLDSIPRVPVVAPEPIAYSEPIQGETVAQFWKRWKATLTPTERKELAVLRDDIMNRQRAPLDDSLPAVPDRRTKVSNTKQPMTPKQEETFLALQKQMNVQETAKLCISLNVRPVDAARLTKQSWAAIRKAVVRLKAETRRNDVLTMRVSVGHQDESQVA